jgi:hypothetical protein
MPAKTARQSPRIEWTFLRGKAFWLLWIGVLIQGLGGFMPGTYLPGEFMFVNAHQPQRMRLRYTCPQHRAPFHLR